MLLFHYSFPRENCPAYWLSVTLVQRFPTGEEFCEIRGGISTLDLSYLFKYDVSTFQPSCWIYVIGEEWKVPKWAKEGMHQKRLGTIALVVQTQSLSPAQLSICRCAKLLCFCCKFISECLMAVLKGKTVVKIQ